MGCRCQDYGKLVVARACGLRQPRAGPSEDIDNSDGARSAGRRQPRTAQRTVARTLQSKISVGPDLPALQHCA
jgi:hypothetical protein